MSHSLLYSDVAKCSQDNRDKPTILMSTSRVYIIYQSNSRKPISIKLTQIVDNFFLFFFFLFQHRFFLFHRPIQYNIIGIIQQDRRNKRGWRNKKKKWTKKLDQMMSLCSPSCSILPYFFRYIEQRLILRHWNVQQFYPQYILRIPNSFHRLKMLSTHYFILPLVFLLYYAIFFFIYFLRLINSYQITRSDLFYRYQLIQ